MTKDESVIQAFLLIVLFSFNLVDNQHHFYLQQTSGALDAVQCLVALDANVAYKDELGNTVIHLAASNIHTNVIEYFIRLNHRHVPTWRILVGKILQNEKATFFLFFSQI